MIAKVNVEGEVRKLDKPWSPVDLAKVNNQVIRLARLEGEFHWHKHTDEDELFYVFKGEIVIQLRDQPNIRLKEGEMAVIPKNVEHCPKSIKTSYVLLFEPFVLKTKVD